jgi:hypothetical protein
VNKLDSANQNRIVLFLRFNFVALHNHDNSASIGQEVVPGVGVAGVGVTCPESVWFFDEGRTTSIVYTGAFSFLDGTIEAEEDAALLAGIAPPGPNSLPCMRLPRNDFFSATTNSEINRQVLLIWVVVISFRSRNALFKSIGCIQGDQIRRFFA